MLRVCSSSTNGGDAGDLNLPAGLYRRAASTVPELLKARDIIDLLMLSILWGASFLFMRIAVPEFGAFALAEVRVAIAAAVLLPIVLTRGNQTEIAANWSTLAILGAHNTALPFLLFAYATLYLTAGTAGILNATAPIFAAVVARLWLGEKLSTSRALGLVIGIVGIYLLVGDKLSAPGSGGGLAAVAAIGAALLYGIGGNFARTKAAHISSMTDCRRHTARIRAAIAAGRDHRLARAITLS